MNIQSSTWNDCVQYAAVTDVGMRRSNNQDSFVVATAGSPSQWRRRGHLFIVADGMGAHAAGERASQLAVDNVPLSYNKLTQLPPPLAIRRAVLDANTLIHERGQNSVDFHGMGTTCSSLVVLPEGAYVAHVGDSRVYRLRGDVLEQLTFDHSLVWEMAAAGHMSERDIPQYVPKNVITRSLGPHPTVQVDLEGPLPLQEEDTFLVCSDGLTGPVKSEELGAILYCLPPVEAAETMCDLANLRGGPDNITALIIKVINTPTASTSSPVGDDDREERSSKPVPPPLWAAMALSMVATIVLFILSQPVAAAVAGFAFLAAALWAVLTRLTATTNSTVTAAEYGRAPYRQFDCRPRSEMSNALAEIGNQLSDSARMVKWNVDATSFETHRNRAEQAARDLDWQTAVVEHCTAIRVLMQRLRESRDDSGVLS